MAKTKGRLDSDLTNFTILHNEFIDTSSLTVYEKMTFIVIKRFLGREHTAFPSYTLIASRAGISRRKAIDAVASLEAKGILTHERRKSPSGDYTSNIYTLHDHKALWTATDPDETENALRSAKIAESKAFLEKLGYTITEPGGKEKSIDPTPAKAQDQTPSPISNIVDIETSTYDDYTASAAKSQEPRQPERYSMSCVKNLFEYDWISERLDPADLDAVFTILHETLNSTRVTFRIEKEDMPREAVVSKLLKLTGDDVVFAVERFHSTTERIRNVKGYLRSCLYNAREQAHLDLMNEGHHNGDF